MAGSARERVGRTVASKVAVSRGTARSKAGVSTSAERHAHLWESTGKSSITPVKDAILRATVAQTEAHPRTVQHAKMALPSKPRGACL